MPLHLLGKKSWNVYNQENIERVRRDEAQAQLQEEEEDRRTQAIDSERRLKLLRGENVEDLPLPAVEPSEPQNGQRRREDGHNSKKRKLAGEDDTDRDIRLARADTLLSSHTPTQPSQSQNHSKSIDGPIQDSNGHINLFPASALKSHEPNPEAETERARKKREYEDQYTMRLSNAAGFKKSLDAPWYSSVFEGKVGDGDGGGEVGKDVWGNEDSGRHRRDQVRVNASDPLAAMKRGVRRLREVEKGRKAWVDERARELEGMKEEDKGQRSRKHKRRHRERDSLEEFSLDQPSKESDRRRRHHGHRARSHRSRSPQRERELKKRETDRGTHRSRN